MPEQLGPIQKMDTTDPSISRLLLKLKQVPRTFAHFVRAL